MKPVLVLQHIHIDGPAYLEAWLRSEGVPFELRNTEAGDAYPDHLRNFGALAILGGEMSANDPLPSLRQAETLIREAVAHGVPVIGHCLGGQLMARALGARVSAAKVPEIGWHEVEVLDVPEARYWFGTPGPATVFQWHFESFELPAGAVPLARSGPCAHQAFTLGPHLAMQFHVEIDEHKLDHWSRSHAPGYVDAQARHAATVHAGDAMRRDASRHLATQQALAARLYERWLAPLRNEKS